MSDVKELHRQFREAQRRKRECRGQMIKIFPGDVERLKQRLLNNRVEVEGPLPTQCWQWTGATLQNGYGLIRHRGRQFKAHRLAYYLFVGDFPEEAYICHHCDNKGCVNPSHAYVGDAQTNSDDKWERGNPEVLRGEQNGTAVLSEAQVIEVRELVDKGHSKVLVAEQFGVTDVLIGMIARGEAWTQVGGPLTVTKRCKSSRFRGVTKHAGGKWEAEIRINRQRMYLGLFTTEEEAALAFNRAILLNRLDRPLSIYQYQPMENRA